MEKIFWYRTYGYENFITENERITVLDSLKDYESKFSENDKKRVLWYKDFVSPLKELIDIFRDRIIEIDSLKNFKIPKDSEVFLTTYQKGSECVLHQDVKLNYSHNRYNIMISKPDEGGLTIINDELLEIEEKTLWLCQASEYIHGTTPIESQKPRIIISIGFDLEKSS